MKNNMIDYKSVIKMRNQRFIIAISLFLLILISRQFIVEYQISQDESLSRVVNVAGRQKMLSQKITKDIFALYLFDDAENKKLYLEDLKASLSLWKKSNIDLQNGNVEEGLLNNNSREIDRLFSAIEKNHQLILTAAYDVIDLIENSEDNMTHIYDKVKIVIDNEKIFLEGMNQIVDQYNHEDRNRIHIINITELVAFAFIIGTLFFEIFFIFSPTQKSLMKAYVNLNGDNENMKKIFASIHGALFIIDVQDFRILMINKDAEKFINKNMEGVSFIKAINWNMVEEKYITELINQEEVNNIELEISDKENRKITVLLSSIKGHYSDKDAIMVSLYDITLQKQAEEAMRKLAIEDKLTGLYNLHFMYSIMNNELERADRYNYPISIFILDLDYFKLVNDNYGHPIGDSVLKETADITSKNIRKSDYLIRLGGEEILLFMPHTNLRSAIDVAEKIRIEIENYTHPIAGIITASFGVAERTKNQSFQNLYEKADIALYHAKEEGRNRVNSFEEQAVEPGATIHLEWKAEWNSGNNMIDRQHKELLDMANEIIKMSISNIDKEEAGQTVDLLIGHIVKHFTYEESILKSIEYPEYLKHIEIHKNLEKKIAELKSAYLKDEIKLLAFFTFIIDDVLTGHLLDIDTKYFPYIPK